MFNTNFRKNTHNLNFPSDGIKLNNHNGQVKVVSVTSNDYRQSPSSRTFTYLRYKLACATLSCTVSVWLQGYGESKATRAVLDKTEYLRSLLAQLNVSKPILVSPSKSGGYSIPFIVQYPQALAGYIPVAPISTEMGRDKYNDLKVRREREVKYVERETRNQK